MNQNLEHLIVLQAQDLELDRFRSDLAKLPQILRAAEKKRTDAEAALKGTQAAAAAEEKLRRDQESEIATLRAKVARLQRSLEGATSSAQVTAFEHEIAFAKGAIASLEDEELASMERTEAIESEEKRTEMAVKRSREDLDGERERDARHSSEWRTQIAGLELQRKELRVQVEEDILAAYDRLRKAKGTAIAEALGDATQGKCAACQMFIRPQRWQDLIGREHADQIFSCESCGRMLFWDPRRDTPRAWEPGDRLRRAQTGSPR